MQIYYLVIKTKKNVLLYENNKVFEVQKNVLRFEFQISYKDSIYAHYGSDNKIKANHEFGKYYFYFFKKNDNVYVNINLSAENIELSNNSIIKKNTEE